MGTEGIQDKYVNPYTDFGFKLLFGTAMNKELLISFLNALLFKEEVIKDVTYLNAEHLGTQEYDRRAVFDVYCENEKGEKFLVEMQRGEQQFFKDRSVFYSTFPIREQAKRGEWDYELKAVYVVGILNFSFDNSDEKYFHHEVKLVDLYTHKVFYDKLTFVYLECLNSIRLRMSWIVCLTSGCLSCVILPLCLNVPEHYRIEFLIVSLKLRKLLSLPRLN